MSIVTVTLTYLMAALRMATPLTLAGLGEAYSEKAGILNIGLEAVMLAGAFTGFITTYYTQSVFLGILAAIVGGVIVSMLHAVLCIKCKANQTIVGLALNFLILGMTNFLFFMMFGKSTELPLCKVVPNSVFMVVMFIAVIAFYIVFYKTEWGVRLSAVGENPRAADTAGINVYATRYFAMMINGMFGGLAGAFMTLSQLGFFMENVTAGKGYIALVAVILGKRNPFGILAAALVIGFAEALQFNLQTMGIPIPSQVFTMFPYVAAVIVLLLSIGRNHDPSALGIPYERNKR